MAAPLASCRFPSHFSRTKTAPEKPPIAAPPALCGRREKKLLPTCSRSIGFSKVSPNLHDFGGAASSVILRSTKARREEPSAECPRQASMIIRARTKKIIYFSFSFTQSNLCTYFSYQQYFIVSPYSGIRADVGYENKIYECSFLGEKLPCSSKICHHPNRSLQ